MLSVLFLLTLVTAFPQPTPIPNDPPQPRSPQPTEAPGLMARLLAERANPSALTVYQPVGDSATSWPGEIIPPEGAVGWPHDGCKNRCEDYRATVEKCNYKPEVSDIDTACMCREETQRQMFSCFECEMTLYEPWWSNGKWDQRVYYVALSDRFLRQCEQDSQPVNLTHYDLWKGYIQSYVSGKSKQTYVTRAYFVPSAADHIATCNAGTWAVAMMSAVWSACLLL